MAKYVCDFDQVIAAGDKLCSTASEMTTAISNYSTKVTSDLSSWTGSAKASFTTQCEGQVQIATANAQKMNAVGEAIKKAAMSIQELETQLASQSI